MPRVTQPGAVKSGCAPRQWDDMIQRIHSDDEHTSSTRQTDRERLTEPGTEKGGDRERKRWRLFFLNTFLSCKHASSIPFPTPSWGVWFPILCAFLVFLEGGGSQAPLTGAPPHYSDLATSAHSGGSPLWLLSTWGHMWLSQHPGTEGR